MEHKDGRTRLQQADVYLQYFSMISVDKQVYIVCRCSSQYGIYLQRYAFKCKNLKYYKREIKF